MDTKKNEIIICTSEPSEMIGKYTAERVVRGWTEEFVDEDTGDIVPIERKEVIMDRGTFLENEKISTIMFHLQSGDLEHVKLSNQKREGVFVIDGHSQIWSTVIEVGKKKVKLLLYANSFETATDIIKDYVELNYSGYCKLSQLKEFGHYTVIEEAITKDTPDSDKEKKLYKMEININSDGYVYSNNFLIFATDVESAKTAIDYWIGNELKENHGQAMDFTSTMESAVIISYSAIIDRAFSQEYIENKKTEEDGNTNG